MDTHAESLIRSTKQSSRKNAAENKCQLSDVSWRTKRQESAKEDYFFKKEIKISKLLEQTTFDSEIMKKLLCCCEKGEKEIGCLPKYFPSNKAGCRYNTESVREVIQQCLNYSLFELSSYEAENTFLQELIRTSTVGMKKKAIGEDNFIFNFTLHNMRKEQPVCRETIAIAYGIPLSRISTLSSHMKNKEQKRLPSHKIRKYTDDYIPDFGMGKVEQIFERNVGVANGQKTIMTYEGKRVIVDETTKDAENTAQTNRDENDGKRSLPTTTAVLDRAKKDTSSSIIFSQDQRSHLEKSRMQRAALISKSPVVIDCILWMEEYFQVCGDHAPNGNEIKLSMSQSEAYNDYRDNAIKLCHSYVPIEDLRKKSRIATNNNYTPLALKITTTTTANEETKDELQQHYQQSPTSLSEENDDDDDEEESQSSCSSSVVVDETSSSAAAAARPTFTVVGKLITKKRKRQLKRMKPFVSFSKFSNLWKSLFPRVVCRPYVEIPGKCFTCYEIDRQRRETSNTLIHKLLAEAHVLHRGGMFMLERLEYKARVRKAINSLNAANHDPNNPPPKIFSVIIDGMDQSHCQIPYLGTQKELSKPLKQHIVGVKEHGYGVGIYRCVDTVSKGANFTIYCFLRQLEEFRKRHESYPDEIYLQVDGGSENANRWVLALLELLVCKRIAKRIYYTRLPTGHTHEEIDAIFGIIWKSLHNEIILTFEDYRLKVLAALSKENLNPTFEDVFLIPNFAEFLTPCIDPKLENLHKEPFTQHQWRFEWKENDPFFPIGCKTTFRSYSSPKVVELHLLPKEQCKSLIGQYTGLEAFTHYSRWYPSTDCDPNRKGVEGFHILHDIPNWESGRRTNNNNQLVIFPPCALESKAYSSIKESLNEIKRFFSSVHEEKFVQYKASWIEWEKKYAPNSENMPSIDYMKKMNEHGVKRREEGAYCIPLREVLLQKSIRLENRHYSWKLMDSIEHMFADERDIKWPEQCSAAVNSVRTSFNQDLMPARVFGIADNSLLDAIENFKDITTNYYSLLKDENTADNLQEKLFRKISVDGNIPPLSGATKQQVVNKIRESDISFVKKFHTPLNDVNEVFVQRVILKLHEHPNLQSIENEEVALINKKIKVSQKVIIRLGMVKTIQNADTDILQAICGLFRDRDETICKICQECATRREYKQSIFLPPYKIDEFMEILNFICEEEEEETATTAANEEKKKIILKYFEGIILQQQPGNNHNVLHRLYCPIRLDNLDDWIILMVEFSSTANTVYYINPKWREGNLNNTTEPPLNMKQKLLRLRNELNRFLQKILNVTLQNRIDAWRFQFYAPQEDDVNSILYVFTALYYLVNDCPLSFKIISLNTQQLRHKLIYFIMRRSLLF